jgi:hypothetical protein
VADAVDFATRAHSPRQRVGGSSFLHVSLIAIIKKIINCPDAFFRPFAQERFKILIRPTAVPRKCSLLSGRRDFQIRPVPFEGRPMLHLPIVAFKTVDDRPSHFVLFILGQRSAPPAISPRPFRGPMTTLNRKSLALVHIACWWLRILRQLSPVADIP